MAFVDHDDWMQLMDTAHEFNLPVQLSLGISSIEFRFTPELLEHPFVEVSGCQLGVGKETDWVLLLF